MFLSNFFLLIYATQGGLSDFPSAPPIHGYDQGRADASDRIAAARSCATSHPATSNGASGISEPTLTANPRAHRPETNTRSYKLLIIWMYCTENHLWFVISIMCSGKPTHLKRLFQMLKLLALLAYCQLVFQLFMQGNSVNHYIDVYLAFNW